MIQKSPTLSPVAGVASSKSPTGALTQTGRPSDVPATLPIKSSTVSQTSAPHALALATAVDGLSDNNLRQLMDDLNNFDALPATEPGPVISVDNGDGLDQGSR
jgi:hypothetical protein